MRSLVAYYGTYDIVASGGRVIHLVDAASYPMRIGKDFVRWSRFEEPSLLITRNNDFTYPLFWKRPPVSSDIDANTHK